VRKQTIGVIGKGFVGGAVSEGFETFAKVKCYDIDPLRTTHNFEEVVNCDFVFICLPTPMVSAEGGETNMSIMNSFFERVAPIAQKNKSIYVIKSTVPIGTTEKLSSRYNIKHLIHNPEFLRERCALADFLNPHRNIVGGSDTKSVNKLAEFLQKVFPDVQCYRMQSGESESVKYFANSFLATKVIFFNEMYLLVKKLGLDWDNVIKGIITDNRIGQSHYNVPGPDGNLGFGGTCFPKDINSLINTFEINNLCADILKAVWNKNKELRQDWDWERFSSAVQEKEIK